MNKLIYVRHYATGDVDTIISFLKNNPEVKINGVYSTIATDKKFKDDEGNWYQASKFISITTNNKYDDLSSIFMVDKDSELTSSANYINSLININPKIIDFDNTKNLVFFNNNAYATYTNIKEEVIDEKNFKYDEMKDIEKKVAYIVADLYKYSDSTYATSCFNDKLHANRNYACNYLKKQFREKGINEVNINLDSLLGLNIDNPNSKEIEKKINYVKDKLKEIHKIYDKSTLGKIRNLLDFMNKEGYTNILPKEELDMINKATSDSKEFRAIYNRLLVIQQVKAKEKEVANKQAFGRNAKEILNKIGYDNIKAKRIEIFGNITNYSPDEYKNLIPDWLINRCNKALETSVDEFLKIKANYFNYFFDKADKELNRRYALLDYIENTGVRELSVHKGLEKKQVSSSSKDWTNPNALKDYKNEEKYINKVPKEFQDLKRFVGYKLEWVSSGKDWVDEFGIPVLDSRGNSIKKPVFDEAGNILTDEFGNPIFEGKFQKIPYSCLTGRKTGSDKPEEWCNYQEAIEGIRKFGLHGLGIELGGEGQDKIVGLDIDHITDENGEYVYEARDVVNRLMSYAWIEKSISGSGLHAIVKGNFKTPENQKRVGNFEMYDEGRFFTISGNAINLNITKSNEGVKALREIHKVYMSKTNTSVKEKSNNDSYLKVEYENEKELYSTDEILRRCYNSWDRRKDLNNGINKFDDIYNGNFYGYFKEKKKVDDKTIEVEGSQNIADYWLINQVRFFGATKKQADEIMRMSRLMRDKWDSQRGKNESYGSITINMVYSENKEVFNPSYKKDKNKKNNEIEKG